VAGPEGQLVPGVHPFVGIVGYMADFIGPTRSPSIDGWNKR
jgi:hypothetical protein